MRRLFDGEFDGEFDGATLARNFGDRRGVPWERPYTALRSPAEMKVTGNLLLLALLIFLFVAGVGVGVAPARAQSETPELDRQVREIASSLRCPVCQNLSVADSPSPLAVEMRGIIRRKLEAGESREAITQYFVTSYGESVLLDPPRQGFTLLVWLGAAASVVGGLFLVIAKVRRALPPAREESPQEATLPLADAERSRYEARLDAELARYEAGAGAGAGAGTGAGDA